MRWRGLVGILCMFCLPVLAHENAPQAVRLATATSVQSSGFLDKLVSAFEQQTGTKLVTMAVGSGRALHKGRLGKVDVILVHAPAAEEAFIAAGFGERRIPIMQNRFLIVGPPSDPAGIKGNSNAIDALRRIAVSKSLFISRADESGTNKKEQLLWRAANIEPYGSWYYEAGTSMDQAFRLANERLAYTLVDLGTWLAGSKGVSLMVMVDNDPRLENHYSIVTLSKAKFPHLNHTGAEIFIDWLRSDKGAAIIKSMIVDGEPLYRLPSVD